jgi:hypothetical protein
VRTELVRGQQSFRLGTNAIQLAVTRTGAMLGPVTFFADSACPVEPYAVAPWAEEHLCTDIPNMLRALRGDWFCSAFGENREQHEGQALPPHGETANREWHWLAGQEADAGSWLRLGVDLPLQGGRCEGTTALLRGHSVIYQRHDLRGLRGPINPGHHATLAFPDIEGAGRLSFSRLIHARTSVEPTARPEEGGNSWLKPDREVRYLRAAPCVDGSVTDLSRYPARRGFEDIAILCVDPTLDLAWSAVTLPEAGYAWFALRDPRQLASTLLWFSNGGRDFAPWNGRHVNVLGVEDVTAFFHVGTAASCRENALTERGIRTCLEPDSRGCLSIKYIQGVTRIPPEFDRIADIEIDARKELVLMRADSGATVSVPCDVDFLRTGVLKRLEMT